MNADNDKHATNPADLFAAFVEREGLYVDPSLLQMYREKCEERAAAHDPHATRRSYDERLAKAYQAKSCATGEHVVSPLAKPGYCFQCVMAAARQRCIDRGEGWRWGVSRAD